MCKAMFECSFLGINKSTVCKGDNCGLVVEESCIMDPFDVVLLVVDCPGIRPE